MKVFVNIREIWQEVNRNFLSSDENWELSLRTCSDVHLSFPWCSWGSLGVRSCNLVRPSWARFRLSHLLLPSPHSWDASYCPAQEVRLSLLLTHPHLVAFLFSTYCFPPSLLRNCGNPLGPPGVQSSAGSSWDLFSLLDWVIAVMGKGVLVSSFSTHWTSQVFSAPSVKCASYKCVNSIGVWWCPLHKQVHLNPRFCNVILKQPRKKGGQGFFPKTQQHLIDTKTTRGVGS